MKISFSIQAWEEYLYFQSQDKKALKKINELIKDVERNGVLNGIGKPEKLTNNLSGLYSRRINDKDRLVYKLEKVGEAHFFACHRAKELGFVNEK